MLRPYPKRVMSGFRMTGLIGRKLGMTRVFDAEGTHVPVTVIEAGPGPGVQGGQSQGQLGFGTKKPTRTAKALAGHVEKAGLGTAPRVLEGFPLSGGAPKGGGNRDRANLAP